MSIHLIGGGRDTALCGLLLAPFVAEAVAAAGAEEPVISLLIVREADDDAIIPRFVSVLKAAGAPEAGIRVEAIIEGARFSSAAVDAAHGIFVGGGLTPAYHHAFADIVPATRVRVAGGTPYAGFSAGAAIAASRALVGGHRIGGAAVCPEDAAEELEEVEVRDGLGLVPMAIEVHAAQWGTLSRLVAAVSADLIPRGIAIDDHTALGWDPATAQSSVHGAGRAWIVERAPSGVHVSATQADTPS
jgi:cyanophycinase